VIDVTNTDAEQVHDLVLDDGSHSPRFLQRLWTFGGSAPGPLTLVNDVMPDLRLRVHRVSARDGHAEVGLSEEIRRAA
jgi:hypothetical protein